VSGILMDKNGINLKRPEIEIDSRPLCLIYNKR
jgi:hypothetical protein